MKDLIIGCMSGYDFPAVRPWVKSIAASGFTGDRVAIVLNGSFETIRQLVAHGVQRVFFDRDDARQVVTWETTSPCMSSASPISSAFCAR